jgi:hypothetical protein
VIADLGAVAVKDQNALCAQRGGDPVRDDDQRAVPVPERGFRLPLRGGIEVARSLVQDCDRSPGQVSPGSGSQGTQADSFGRGIEFRRGWPVGRGGCSAEVQDVLGERPGEDVRLLRDEHSPTR